MVSDLPSTSRDIFLAWEKLRLIYNGILIPWTLYATLAVWYVKISFGDVDPSDANYWQQWKNYWILVGASGIISNVCFLLGPACEVYIAWLGWSPRWLRGTVFVLGTLFTMAAVYAWVPPAVPPVI